MAELPLNDPLLQALREACPAVPSSEVDSTRTAATALLERILEAKPAPAQSPPAVPRARRTLPRVAAAGALAAGVVAVAAVAVTSTGGSAARHPASARRSTAAPAARVPDARTVAFHTRAALDAAGTADVEAARTTISGAGGPSGGALDSWSYRASARTESLDPDGAPVADLWYEATGCSFTGAAVSYPLREWWPIQDGDPMTVMMAGPLGDRYLGSSDQAATIEHLLAAGDLTVVGQPVVDGRQTVELAGTAPTFQTLASGCGSDAPPSGDVPVADQLTFTLWVDPSTYLPLQETLSQGSFSISSTVSWLPATPDNLALLQGTVPAGFVELSAPPAAIPAG